MPRQFVACKFRVEDKRAFTYHNDGPPVADGDWVKVPDRSGDGWKKVYVFDANAPKPTAFETKPILGKLDDDLPFKGGYVGDSYYPNGGTVASHTWDGKRWNVIDPTATYDGKPADLFNTAAAAADQPWRPFEPGDSVPQHGMFEVEYRDAATGHLAETMPADQINWTKVRRFRSTPDAPAQAPAA